MNEYEIWIANRLPGIQYRNQYLGVIDADNQREAEEMAHKLFSSQIYGFCYGNETRLIVRRINTATSRRFQNGLGKSSEQCTTGM